MNSPICSHSIYGMATDIRLGISDVVQPVVPIRLQALARYVAS